MFHDALSRSQQIIRSVVVVGLLSCLAVQPSPGQGITGRIDGTVSDSEDQAPVSAQVYYPPPDSAGGWRTLADPGQVRQVAGIDVNRLDGAFEYAKRTSQHGGLLVIRRGWLVYERYFGRASRDVTPSTASIGKTFTAIACGIMLRDHRDRLPDGLDTKVFTRTYLPDAFPLSDPRKADITLGQLLAMSSGMSEYASGGAPPTVPRFGYVDSEAVPLAPGPAADPSLGRDLRALRAPMWTAPGGGYVYSTSATHVLSILVHGVTGQLMEDYLREKLATPMQWGPWGWPPSADGTPQTNTPGGGGVAVRATDMLRYGYMLLHKGRSGNQQLVPASFIEHASRPSPYNPHTMYSFQFTSNQDGHLAGAPRDAYFKSGTNGYGLYVVPSLDLVVWKIGGVDAQYQWTARGLPQNVPYDGSRATWRLHPHDQFHDPPPDVETGVRRTLELVVSAVVDY